MRFKQNYEKVHKYNNFTMAIGGLDGYDPATVGNTQAVTFAPVGGIFRPSKPI